MKLTITMTRIGILFSFLLGAFASGAQGPVAYTVETQDASSCFQNDGSIVINATGGVVGEMGMGTVGQDCAEGTVQQMTKMARNVFALTLINPEAYCSHSHVEGTSFSYMIDVFNPETNIWTEIYSTTTGSDCYYFPESINFAPQSAISAIRFRSSPDTNCGMHVQGLSFKFEAFGYQYSIDGGATWSQSNRFSNLPPGMYQVKVQDGLGNMSLTQAVIVAQAPATAVDAGDDLYVVAGTTAQLNATGNNLGEVLYGASADPEEFCIFDADGGGTDCSVFGTSICTEGYVWQYNDATQSSSIMGAELASVESLKLSVYYSCGDYSQPDGYNKWDLYINGVLVGSTGETSSQGCTCEAASFGTFPKEFTFDDFAVLNSAWEEGGANNVEIVYNSRYNTGIALSAYKLMVTYGGIQTYEWSPSESLTASNIANPVASPTQTTEYTISYTDKYGCKATDNVKVNVLPGTPGPGPGPGPTPVPTPDLFNVKTNDATVSLGADGTTEITADLINDGSTAVAGIESLSVSTSAVDCQSLGAIDVYLIVEDKLGRKDSAAATVTVMDDTAPSVSLNGEESIVHERYTEYSDAGATSSDNCEATLTVDGAVDITVAGVYTITYTVVDPSGNQATVSRQVEVVDDEDDDNDGIPDTVDEYILDPNNNGAPVIVSFVWDDLDGDGIQDDGEPGIQGVAVNLLSGTNETLAEAVSGDDGLVAFFDLSTEETYRIQFKRPHKYGFTLRDAGDDDTVDSDTNHKTKKFKVSEGINDQWDIGFTSPGGVQSFVWDDQNGDGMQDDGEPGLKGITVRMLDLDGNELASTKTDKDGYAIFDDVAADGKFRLEFVKPDGHNFTYGSQGANENKDSDANRKTGQTRAYKLNNGEKMLTSIDAGLWSPGTVEAYVWDDRNGDGLQDADEPAIKGVWVELQNTDGEQLKRVKTDNAGIATISDVPADQILMLQFEKLDGYGVTWKNRGSDELNSDVKRLDLTSRKFKATMGAEVFSTYDAGYWSPGTVQTFVWYDANGDGIQDIGEPGLSNVKVNLLNKAKEVIGEATTNSSGIAEFTDVPADIKYLLEFVTNDFQDYTLREQGVDTSLDSDARPQNGQTRKHKMSMGAQLVQHIDAGYTLSIQTSEEGDNVLDLETPSSSLPPPRLSFFRTETVPLDEETEFSMDIYPNPATDKISVNVANTVEENMVLSIVDMAGRTVIEEEMHFEIGLNTIEIDFGQLKVSDGQLILRLVSPSRGQLIRQLIKH